MSGAPTIGAVLPYFGGKRTLAPRIVAELDGRANYCEPFMGSLAVLLARRPGGVEIAGDLYGHGINLARVLASDRCADLYAMVSRTVLHDGLHAEAQDTLGDDLSADEVAPSVAGVTDAHVRLAYWLLVRDWQGRNGVSGTLATRGGIARRYTAKGGSPTARWRSVAESIPAWHERLRSVVFDRVDALEMITKIDDAPEWAIYADPPYLRKSTPYIHDADHDVKHGGDPEAWHRRLAAALNAKARARVVVSYYAHPLLEELYPRDRWTWVDIEMSKATSNASARDGSGARATELLIINGPSVADRKRRRGL